MASLGLNDEFAEFCNVFVFHVDHLFQFCNVNLLYIFTAFGPLTLLQAYDAAHDRRQ